MHLPILTSQDQDVTRLIYTTKLKRIGLVNLSRFFERIKEFKMKIEDIDKNFAAKKAQGVGGNVYKLPCKPFGLYGGYYDEENGFIKMPTDFAYTISEGVGWGSRCGAGIRITFSTNSKYLKINSKIFAKCVMYHMPLVGSAGFTLEKRDRKSQRFVCNLTPSFDVKDDTLTGSVNLSGKMTDYTLFLPLYSGVISLEIELSKGSVVKAYDRYENKKKILYYGSSITQGGCASRADNCYQALVSEWTDTDYYILGFSGNARGEKDMAKYIADFDCDIFVCDYDHNAPTIEHLKNTHKELYKTFRKEEKNKDVPVIFLTKPDYRQDENAIKRIDIVRETYEYALSTGDKNVYFIDGRTLYPKNLYEHCSVDGTHPADLGFYFFAKRLTPIIKKLI